MFTQLPDGKVPSFEEYKAIKDKIIRSSQGIGEEMSAFKINENKQKDIEEYLKLEQLAEEYPKARARISSLQQQL